MTTAMRNPAADVSYDVGERAFFLSVFSRMGIGLLITAAISWYLANTPGMLEQLFNMVQTTGADGKTVTKYNPSALWLIAVLAQLGMVIAISWGGLTKGMSGGVATTLFYGYAALTGFTLAPVIAAYTSASVVYVFFVSASVFGGAALMGYTTKIDLTGMGNFFLMALIGLLVALVAGWFIQSTIYDIAVSCAAVLLFVGLTAFDMQNLRNIYHDGFQDEKSADSLAAVGALTLYLDFINLFLHLLRLLGEKK